MDRLAPSIVWTNGQDVRDAIYYKNRTSTAGHRPDWPLFSKIMTNSAPSSPSHSFIEELLGKMTLAEKIGQMTQHAYGIGEPEEVEQAVRQGKIGSFLNATPLEIRNSLQELAVEETRLGIPLVFGRDVIHGYRTIYPIPVGLSATFDPALVEETAAAAAREAVEDGTDWTFAPMVDVTREPRWGRIAESPGEDPYLASQMGAAMVRGFQGDDPSQPDRLAACAKHFAGYGAVEAGKDYNSTWIPEGQLRELHLAAFRACVEAGVLTVMSGFNDLNGIPVTASELLLRRILKKEWGFAGMVVSDWASASELISHGLCENEKDAARATLIAGLDMEMATKNYSEHLETLVADNPELLKYVDDSARRVLSMKHTLGLFERPYITAPTTSVAVSVEHLALARRSVHKSVVLLKNENSLLPLRGDEKKIALIGPLSDDQENQLGCWAYDAWPDRAVTLKTELESRLGQDRIVYAPGLIDARSADTSKFDEAVRAAEAAEVAVVVLGEDANISGEAKCRAFLDLPGVQRALLERLAETGIPLVVIVMAGRPLLLGPVCASAQSVLFAWHPGTQAGPGLADLLFGEVAPSGRLPVSFPRAVGQIPIYYASKNTGRPAPTEFQGIPEGTPLDPVGFASSYLDVEVSPLFPFGFGLSYTEFAYSDLKISRDESPVGTPVEVSVRVRNTGERTAEEVVQLYVRDLVASVTRPLRELKGIFRVRLAPGESREIQFTLTSRELEFVGRDMKHIVEPGKFQVFVGGSSTASLQAEFELI